MKHVFVLIVGACCACREVPSRDSTWQSKQSTTTANTYDIESKSAPTEASVGTDGNSTARPTDTAKPAANDDHEFISTAIQGGLFEIESSRIALDKNVSEAIRNFAQMMVDDHRKANEELMVLVQRKNAKAPTEMSREQKLELDELQHLNGQPFDRRYFLAQVNAHDRAIELFEHASQTCEDRDLREYASRLLPTLREHRRYLEQHPM